MKCGAWQSSVPAIGFTSFDQRQPTSKVPFPTVPLPIFTTSMWPFPNRRTSSGESRLFFSSPAITSLLPFSLPYLISRFLLKGNRIFTPCQGRVKPLAAPTSHPTPLLRCDLDDDGVGVRAQEAPVLARRQDLLSGANALVGQVRVNACFAVSDWLAMTLVSPSQPSHRVIRRPSTPTARRAAAPRRRAGRRCAGRGAGGRARRGRRRRARRGAGVSRGRPRRAWRAITGASTGSPPAGCRRRPSSARRRRRRPPPRVTPPATPP